MSIDNSFKARVALRKEIRDLLLDFIKHIVTVSSALLALLISLSQPSSGSIYLFYAVLLLLLLSILAGSSTLYIVLVQFCTMDKDLQEHILSQIQNGDENFRPVLSKHDTLLKWAETTCVFSFLLACMALVAFALLR